MMGKIRMNNWIYVEISNISKVMWMLPFVTRSDLEAVDQQTDVIIETRNHFLNKLLLEHGQPSIRQQLHTLWIEWVEKTYDEQQAPAVAASLGMEAATPPADDEEESTAAAGGGG